MLLQWTILSVFSFSVSMRGGHGRCDVRYELLAKLRSSVVSRGRKDDAEDGGAANVPVRRSLSSVRRVLAVQWASSMYHCVD